jgi:hypothetical protein
LGAGQWTVGADVQPGRYVMASGGGSGNFFIRRDGRSRVNEILSGSYGVPSVTADLRAGDTIEISGLRSVSFTPAETALSLVLTTGYWTVGLDIPSGRYTATPPNGESGNFFVRSGSRSVVNEILGGSYGVPSYALTLTDGQEIEISGLSSVSFIT